MYIYIYIYDITNTYNCLFAEQMTYLLTDRMQPVLQYRQYRGPKILKRKETVFTGGSGKAVWLTGTGRGEGEIPPLSTNKI